MNKGIVKFNNFTVWLRRKRSSRNGMLLLFPTCLQNSSCPQNLINDLSSCKRCGRCKVKDILEISEEYDINCAIASGGRLALEKVKAEDIRGVVAIACEKELRTGILGAFPKAVIGIVNYRPNGPCKDTDVDLDEVKKAIESFLK